MTDLLIIVGVASIVSGYQVYRCIRYLGKSVRLKQTYDDKIKQGCMQAWEYLFFFIPVHYRDYYDSVGLQGAYFYLSPLVLFFALFGNPLLWSLVLFCFLLSLGRGVFKLFNPLLLRLPFYWGYFASLLIVWLSVEGLRLFALNNQQLSLLCVMVGILLLFNSDNLPPYPYNMWARRPSVYFNTPLLKWLEKHAKGYRVNNLPYPVYHGQINHIKSMGYMGGNHILKQGEFRGIDRKGAGGYNWFDYLPDSYKLDQYGVKYHIGNRPSADPKWKKIECFDNLWENTMVTDNVLFE